MSAQSASAQHAQPGLYDFTDYTLLSPEQTRDIITGRTFWDRMVHDRTYFGEDGTFVQQVIQEDGIARPGTIFTGTWRMDSDGAVCWSYNKSNDPDFVLSEGEVCYEFYIGPERFRPLPKYTDPLYVVEKGDKSRENASYFWNRYIDGRVILAPSFAQNFLKTIDYMKSFRRKFNAFDHPDTPPMRDPSALNEDMKAYVELISGNVLFTPYHFLYFGEDGDYIFYTRSDIAEANGDIAAIKEKARHGRWIVHDNMHCWSLYKGRGRTTCHYVARGKTLDHGFDGFVTHVQDGFSRFLNGQPVGLTTVQGTKAPAAIFTPQRPVE
jgi:hypothetical protein